MKELLPDLREDGRWTFHRRSVAWYLFRSLRARIRAPQVGVPISWCAHQRACVGYACAAQSWWVSFREPPRRGHLGTPSHGGVSWGGDSECRLKWSLFGPDVSPWSETGPRPLALNNGPCSSPALRHAHRGTPPRMPASTSRTRLLLNTRFSPLRITCVSRSTIPGLAFL